MCIKDIFEYVEIRQIIQNRKTKKPRQFRLYTFVITVFVINVFFVDHLKNANILFYLNLI